MPLMAPASTQRLYASRLTAKQPVRLKAVNVVIGLGEQWSDMWSLFEWERLLRPQIDLAISMGANAIKMVGSGINGEAGTNYPSDVLLKARIEQVCGYARSHGLVVYWNLAAHPSYIWGAAGTTPLSTTLPTLQKVAGWLENIPNVVGIDVVNEINNGIPTTWNGPNYAQFLADTSALLAGIRKATSLPLTVSIWCQTVADITNTYAATIASQTDFHDFHPYYTGGTPAATDVTSLRTQGWYLGRYLIGECGSNLSQGTTAQTNFTAGIGALGANADSFGSVLFCASDYDNTSSATKFGVVDSTMQNPRSQITTPFAAWSGAL